MTRRLRGGTFRVVRHKPGAPRSWTVALGDEPSLRFRPLRATFERCTYVYRGTVEEPTEGERESATWRATEAGDVVAGQVDWDLRGWTRRTVRLTFDVTLEGDGCSDALRARTPVAVWGSPAIYHRVPATVDNPGSLERPNVLLVSLDALRADALGMGGRLPTLSPTLDRLAIDSDVWTQAFSTFNVTNPSFASIFTGRYGKHHGVYDLQTPLPDEHPTLAGLLRDAGYDTAALVAAHHLRADVSGLGRGFDAYTVATRQWSAEHAVDRAMAWIQDQEQRFFLWLHLFDPHTPHRPPGRFAIGERPDQPYGLADVTKWVPFRPLGRRPFTQPRLGAHRDLHDGEVAYVDRQIDRLLGFLTSRRLLDRTLLVVLSDHGENHGERGIHFRHAGLWDATTHVPLLIRRPGGHAQGRRLDGLAQTIDVFPTVLRHLGLNVPPVDGIDLGAVPTPNRRFVYAEHQGALGAMVRNDRFLYSRQRATPVFAGGRFLFDLRADPDQRRNRVQDLPDLAARADRLLDDWLADRASPATAVPISDEERANLRALGYVDP